MKEEGRRESGRLNATPCRPHLDARRVWKRQLLQGSLECSYNIPDDEDNRRRFSHRDSPFSEKGEGEEGGGGRGTRWGSVCQVPKLKSAEAATTGTITGSPGKVKGA